MGLTDNVSVLCFAAAATSVAYMSLFYGQDHGNIYTFDENDLQTFRREGILIVRDQMFDGQRLENITQESLLRVQNRPEGKRQVKCKCETRAEEGKVLHLHQLLFFLCE